MINWQQHIIEELKCRKKRHTAQIHIQKRIRDLNDKISSPKLASIGGIRAGKDQSKMEDTLLSYIAEKYELEKTYNQNQIDLNHIEQGIEQLPTEDQDLINRLYLLRQSIEQIALELNIDRSTLYRRRNEILRTLTLILYGRMEI